MRDFFTYPSDRDCKSALSLLKYLTYPSDRGIVHERFFYISARSGGSLLGKHKLGSIGGVLYNYLGNDYEKIRLYTAAHELGHWLNLIHTFLDDPSRDYPIVDELGKTNENIMDYNIPSLTWYKLHLEKMNRTE